MYSDDSIRAELAGAASEKEWPDAYRTQMPCLTITNCPLR